MYQVIASSNNPSTLTFSLSISPTGMTMDAASGVMQWTPNATQVGDQPVTITVQDSAGQTSQSFTLSVFGGRPVASAKISASAGGSITVNDATSTINGLFLAVPPGALAADTTITISELTPPPTLGGTPHFLLKGFSIDPDGTQLASPAGVNIPYSLSEFSTTQGISIEDFLGVYFLDTQSGGLDYLNSFSVDGLNHVLRGTVQHFSSYAATSTARLCPPHLSQNENPSSCPNSYNPATFSQLPPAVLVHGFIVDLLNPFVSMGDEGYWGRLRYLLGGFDPGGGPDRVDVWRFDWDSHTTTFERSAANLDSALCFVEVGLTTCPVQPISSPIVANVVAHSFGGILVRTYLEGLANSSDPVTTPNLPYRNDVNRVMTMGTPHSGIGGNFSTYYANACASSTQFTLSHEPITCFEADTGGPALFTNTGASLRTLNSQPLPSLNPFLTPQYDFIAGQRMDCKSMACTLQSDDGLITTLGNELCGTLTGTGGHPAVCSQLTSKQFIEEINPGNLPANTGLCHSSGLFGLFGLGRTCDPNNNIGMTNFNDSGHPLWNKICNFLGGCPRILTVSSTNPNTGVLIAANPIGIGGLSGVFTQSTLAYTGGTVVTLTAPPTAGGNNFSTWAGCDTFSGNVCTVTMNVDRSVIANYTSAPPPTHTLTVASTNPASGVTVGVSPAGNGGQTGGSTQFVLTYNNGTMVTLTAPVSAGGNNFSSWTGCNTVAATTCSVTLNSDRLVTANYISPNPGPHTLQVASTNPAGGAVISVNPADNAGKTNGTTQFTLIYNNGVTVTLTAAATAGGHNFSSWTGCDSVSGIACTVTINSDRAVSANYGASPGFAYVANQNSGDVSAYQIDPATGTLTSVGTFTSGLAPASVAANPSGQCLYVANSQDPLTIISVFSINTSTGTLTPAPSVPSSLQEFFPMSIAIHPTGNYLYAVNLEGTISGFTINPSTCALTRFSGSAYAAGTLPQFVTLDPSGNYLYAINFGDSTISGFSINQISGALTPIGPPFPVPTGNGPTSLAIHPNGKLAFGTSTDNQVLVYSRDTLTGALTQVGFAALAGASFSTVVDQTGNFLFVADSGGTPGAVDIFAIDSTTGALTPVGASATGMSPLSLNVDPSGKFLYVANNGSTSVSAFQIDLNTGALTPVPPVGYFPAGGGPVSVTTTVASPGH